MDPLFRPEAIAAAHASPPGTPLRARQPSWRAVVLLLTPAVLVGAMFVGFAEFEERIHSEGSLLPAQGLLLLPAPSAGTVVAVHARQGDSVAVGAPLFEVSAEITDPNAQADREGQQLSLRRELAQLARTVEDDERGFAERARALQARRASLQADHDSLLAQQELERARLRLSEHNLPGLRQLAERGLLSALQMSDHEAAVLRQRAEQLAGERQRRAVKRELDALDAELGALPRQWRLRLAEHERRKDEVGNQLAELERGRSRVVRAQAAGVLVGVLVQPGASVSAGQTMAALAAGDAPLRALVLLPAGAPGQLQVGDAAVVRLPAFPHQRFGHFEATVLEISGAALSPQQLAQEGISPPAAAAYRVVLGLDRNAVEVDGKSVSLKAGMAVQADLLLGRRRLLDRLIDPLRIRATRAG